MQLDYDELNSLFSPKSMAVIGATANLASLVPMTAMVKLGFKGQFYHVNQSGTDVLGLKAYTSLKDIPGPVDYAFVQVPAKATVQVLKDCVAKGVKLVTLFTAGFSESENEFGAELEQELLNIARADGVRLLGPNCMGIYDPFLHLTFGPLFSKSGPVGILCQSGGYSYQLVSAAVERGVFFSKVISYGNALDINEVELMEYFAQDQETKLVIAYIEGVRDGTRFFQALKATTRIKPVIVFKGGQTPAGAVAALSHTSSLAGSQEVWDSLIKQAGAIQAHSIEECVDIAAAFSLMKTPASRRAVVIGYGGGATVQAADDCYRANLQLPPIPDNIKEQLIKTVSTPGNIFKNPLDVLNVVLDANRMGQTTRTIGKWSGADFLLLILNIQLTGDFITEINVLEPTMDAFISTTKETGKPAAVVVQAIYSRKAYEFFFKARQMCAEASIAFYPSVRQAVNAVDKVITYNEGLKVSS